jgi:hypothetical protein
MIEFIFGAIFGAVFGGAFGICAFALIRAGKEDNGDE